MFFESVWKNRDFTRKRNQVAKKKFSKILSLLGFRKGEGTSKLKTRPKFQVLGQIN